MARVDILTCSNTTKDIACSSFGCLNDVNHNKGEFERYKGNGGTELAGIINCAGCPTTLVPEKLLGRIRSLSVLGVEAIHMSSCMLALCPYKK